MGLEWLGMMMVDSEEAAVDREELAVEQERLSQPWLNLFGILSRAEGLLSSLAQDSLCALWTRGFFS